MVITLSANAASSALLATATQLLSPTHLEETQLAGERSDLGELNVVEVTGQTFTQALRVATLADPGTEWGLQAVAEMSKDIAEGDVVLARFNFRCVDSMSGDACVGLVIVDSTHPVQTVAELRVGTGSKWLGCYLPFRSPRRLPAGSTRLCFRVGFDRQTIEIGGIELLNLGPNVDPDHLPRTRVSYAGREAGASWRNAALKQIEANRKATIRVEVIDDDGHPVPNADVQIELIRHAFGFGSCVAADQLTGDSADDMRYRQIVERYFNRVVFENDMKWPAMWNGPSDKLERAMQWLSERRIQVRGHNLQWPSWHWSPKDLRRYEQNPQMLGRLCEKRVSEAVSRFKGKLIHWDVVNEPYNNVDLLHLLGSQVMIDWFKLAREADPDCKLYLNDFGIFDGGPASEHRAHFFETIRWLKENGAPIDGIGIQSHFTAIFPPPTQLTAVLDQFAGFGLPIESTEFTLNTTDRALQADYLRDYMIAVFAHPSVEGIMHWGFWEGRHWRPNAALWSRDWQLRPHGQVWVDLLEREWNTNERLTTNERGVVQTHGFLGEYRITVTHAHRQVLKAKLGPDGATLRIVATAPHRAAGVRR